MNFLCTSHSSFPAQCMYNTFQHSKKKSLQLLSLQAWINGRVICEKFKQRTVFVFPLHPVILNCSNNGIAGPVLDISWSHTKIQLKAISTSSPEFTMQTQQSKNLTYKICLAQNLKYNQVFQGSTVHLFFPWSVVTPRVRFL